MEGGWTLKKGQLNLIGTIDEPSSGEIEIFGEKVDKESKDDYLSDLRLKKIGGLTRRREERREEVRTTGRNRVCVSDV